VQEWLHEKARAICRLRASCPTEDRYASVEACMNRHLRVAPVPGSGPGDVEWEAARLVARGDLHFDERQADACLSAIRDGGCTTFSYILSDHGERACEHVFSRRRTVEADAPCGYDLECEPGYFCGEGRSECGGGVCQPYESNSCSSSRDCPEPPSGRAICDRRRCEVVREVVDRSVGEPCETLVDGEERVYGLCASGLACALPLPSGTDGRQCVRLPGPGEPCATPFPYCANNAECVGVAEGVPGQCAAVENIEERQRVGDRCSVAFCDATARLLCDRGRCAEWTGQAGSPCHRDAYPCDAGLHCGLSLRCEIPTTPLGGRCRLPDECAEGCCERFQCTPP
jgi:hypothetical protein